MTHYKIISEAYETVKVMLTKWRDYQRPDEFIAALDVLEEMRRDVEQFDWLLAHQPWHSVVTREKLDVWMRLEGGDAPRTGQETKDAAGASATTNYDIVKADLMCAQANGQSVEGGLAALEEMRRELDELRMYDLAREASNRDLEAKRAAEWETDRLQTALNAEKAANERREEQIVSLRGHVGHLRASYETEKAAREKAEAALVEEHECRIKYQDIVYATCNTLDRLLGYRPGSGILAAKEDIEQAIAFVAAHSKEAKKDGI